jgi:hypothetical protein|tara:strand:+ start:1518 stop:2381 length:864 start_codon:yes stop_codon:yes gene_type:complete
MTIKQYGGVFGRNPTFNDVTIEGQLTFDGDIDINSDLKIDGDLEVSGDVDITSTAANPLALVSTNASGGYATFNNGVQTSLFAGFGSTLMTGATTSDAVLRYDSNDNLYIARGSAKVATFNNTGSLEIANGNVIMGTSGSGIDFSATADLPGSTSELLDDYEESTYSPNLTGSTSGTFSTTDGGKATKIGRMISVQFAIDNAASTSVAGDLSISLPVVISGTVYAPVQIYNVAYPASAKTAYAYVADGTSEMLLYWSNDGSSSTRISNSDLGASAVFIRGTFTYTTS